MSIDVIQVHGEDVVVREDPAKAYRGVNWAWFSTAGFLIIMAIVAAIFLLKASSDGSIESPAQTANTNSVSR